MLDALELNRERSDRSGAAGLCACPHSAVIMNAREVGTCCKQLVSMKWSPSLEYTGLPSPTTWASWRARPSVLPCPMVAWVLMSCSVLTPLSCPVFSRSGYPPYVSLIEPKSSPLITVLSLGPCRYTCAHLQTHTHTHVWDALTGMRMWARWFAAAHGHV